MDRMNSGRAIDLIQGVRPVVIIDEPQSVDNTSKAKEAIRYVDSYLEISNDELANSWNST